MPNFEASAITTHWPAILATCITSRSRKILNKYKDGHGGWSIPYQTSKGEKRLKFANFRDCKSTKKASDCVVNHAMLHARTTTTFERRLTAEVCELCGKTGVPLEIHHVNKVKNLKGKEHWEIVMIAKMRKTLAVCKECHHKIHHP